jgi:hypothetical protein
MLECPLATPAVRDTARGRPKGSGVVAEVVVAATADAEAEVETKLEGRRRCAAEDVFLVHVPAVVRCSSAACPPSSICHRSSLPATIHHLSAIHPSLFTVGDADVVVVLVCGRPRGFMVMAVD